jgi:hypothetical protein
MGKSTPSLLAMVVSGALAIMPVAAIATTTYTDTPTQTTIINGSLTIVYCKTNGLATFSLGGTNRLQNMYSTFTAGASSYASKTYPSHTFSTNNIVVLQDGFGSGKRITFVNSQSGWPTLRQNFYIYDNKPWFLTDINVTNTSAVSCNYMCPIRCDSQAVNINASINKYMAVVPFDNDSFVSYNGQSVTSAGWGNTSYEAMALYDNDSRNGMVIGSISHDTWKTAAWCWGYGYNLDQLQVYSGAADGNTHDTQVAGSISGTSIWSPKILAGYYSDWRDGMEAYGAACAIQNGTLSWSGGVPVGWNSWGGLGPNINFTNVASISGWMANNLQNLDFNNNGVIYCNLDSWWDYSMTFTDLSNLVAVIHANGQKAGIYFGPFVFSGWDLNAQVDNSTNKWGEIVLKKWDGTPMTNTYDGLYPLDPTHPGTKQHINYYIDQFKAMGFNYIKIDFLSHGALEGKHYDPSINTGIQAYNQGMAYVRDRIGGTMYISEAIAPIFPAQYGHSRRISCDIDGTLGMSAYELNNLTYGWWQNGTIYKYTDPDYMKLTSNLEEARTRVNSAVISGTVFLDSNDLTVSNQQTMATSLLLNDRVNSLARKGRAFRAIEGNTGTGAADSFVLNDNGIYYLAVFNYSSSSTKNMSVNLARAGLNGSTNYNVTDIWSGSASTAQGTLSVSLSASQSKMFVLSTTSSLTNGTYKIMSAQSGKALEVPNNQTTNSTYCDQRTYNGGNNQRWTVTGLGGGQYKIVGVQSGRALDVLGGSTANGAAVDIYDYYGTSNQQWTITPLAGGFYKVISLNSSKALDVLGGWTADGAGIDQWSWSGANNQQWSFQTP